MVMYPIALLHCIITDVENYRLVTLLKIWRNKVRIDFSKLLAKDMESIIIKLYFRLFKMGIYLSLFILGLSYLFIIFIK